MGYCIDYEEGKIRLTNENMKKALKVLSGKKIRWCNGFDYENIDFSDNEEVNNYNYDSMSVYDVWEDLRYDVDYIDDSWYICGFLGEKYGSDDELFNLIAPYCEDGYIQFCGEDGEHFRFVIKDGKFEEVHAKLN